LKDLSEGKSLTGEGCGPAKAAEGGADVPEGFKEMEQAVVDGQTAEIAKVFEGFTKDDELAESAKGCPRAFCVIVLQQNFVPSTGKTVYKYQNYRVVVGPKDNVEKMKTKFADNVKGDFEVVLREQVI
jgi:hypothetical protein